MQPKCLIVIFNNIIKSVLNRGYLPYGLHSKLSLKTGDTVTIPFGDNSYEFTIKGFVQEPAMGTMMIGWKYVFISEEDYNEINVKNKDNNETYVDVLRIFKASVLKMNHKMSL